MCHGQLFTFCRSLDKLIGGAIQVGQITEFCGFPGIGKTQLGIQICLDAQIPEIFNGNGGEAVREVGDMPDETCEHIVVAVYQSYSLRYIDLHTDSE